MTHGRCCGSPRSRGKSLGCGKRKARHGPVPLSHVLPLYLAYLRSLGMGFRSQRTPVTRNRRGEVVASRRPAHVSTSRLPALVLAVLVGTGGEGYKQAICQFISKLHLIRLSIPQHPPASRQPASSSAVAAHQTSAVSQSVAPPRHLQTYMHNSFAYDRRNGPPGGVAELRNQLLLCLLSSFRAMQGTESYSVYRSM